MSTQPSTLPEGAPVLFRVFFYHRLCSPASSTRNSESKSAIMLHACSLIVPPILYLEVICSLEQPGLFRGVDGTRNRRKIVFVFVFF